MAIDKDIQIAAPDARRRWPDVYIKWEQPEVRMKGTPYQAADIESGSIKALRLTATDRRKQSAAKKQRKEQERNEAAAKPASEKGVTSGSSSPRRGAGAGGRGSAGSGSSGTGRRTTSPTTRKAVAVVGPRLPALPSGGDERHPIGVPASAAVRLLLEPRPRPSGVVEDPLSMSSGDDRSGFSTSMSAQVEPWDSVTSVILFEPDSRAAGGEKANVLGAIEFASALAQLKLALAKSRRQVLEDLTREFDVQQSVWDSAALLEAAKIKATLKDVKRPEAKLKAAMQDIINGIEAEEPFAVDSLERVCDEQDKLPTPLLSAPMLKVSRYCVQAKRVAAKRELLRDHLDQHTENELRHPSRRLSIDSAVSVSTIGAVSSVTLDASSMHNGNPEESLMAAELSDPKLEYACRRVFGLPMSIAKERLVKGDWAAECEVGGHSGSFRSQSTDPWCG